MLHDDAPEDSISSSVSAFTLKEFDFQKPPVKIDKEISIGAKLEKSDEVQESESLKPSTYDQEAFSEMKTPQAIVSTVSLTEKTDVSKDVAQNSQDVFVQSTSSTALQPSAAPAEMKSLELELDSLLTGTTSSRYSVFHKQRRVQSCSWIRVLENALMNSFQSEQNHRRILLGLPFLPIFGCESAATPFTGKDCLAHTVLGFIFVLN